jgi:hypothetical protein
MASALIESESTSRNVAIDVYFVPIHWLSDSYYVTLESRNERQLLIPYAAATNSTGLNTTPLESEHVSMQLWNIRNKTISHFRQGLSSSSTTCFTQAPDVYMSVMGFH